MKVLFLQGWHSIVDDAKPTYVKEAGHEVIDPALDDDDFDAAVGPERYEDALKEPFVGEFDITGRAIAGWVEEVRDG